MRNLKRRLEGVIAPSCASLDQEKVACPKPMTPSSVDWRYSASASAAEYSSNSSVYDAKESDKELSPHVGHTLCRKSFIRVSETEAAILSITIWKIMCN